MVEILKQDQYVPMDVSKQIAIIFAAAKGLLDDIALQNLDSEGREKLIKDLEAEDLLDPCNPYSTTEIHNIAPWSERSSLATDVNTTYCRFK